MWGNWSIEEDGIICFLYTQPIASKVVFTYIAQINIGKNDWKRSMSLFLSLSSPSSSPGRNSLMQIINLLYFPVTLCLCEQDVHLPTGLHEEVLMEIWGSKGDLRKQTVLCYHRSYFLDLDAIHVEFRHSVAALEDLQVERFCLHQER